MLCFIEVKTRTSEGLPRLRPRSTEASGATFSRSLADMFAAFLALYRRPAASISSVSFWTKTARDRRSRVHKGAFTWDTDKPRSYWRRDFVIGISGGEGRQAS